MTKLKIIFWVYVALVLCVTLVFFRGTPFARFELNPIASYQRALYADARLARGEIAGVVLNIIMFIPLGFLAPAIWKKFRKFYLLLILVVSATLFIETAQFITSRGVFSLEDIIHNTLGGVFGFIIFKIYPQELNKKKTYRDT